MQPAPLQRRAQPVVSSLWGWVSGPPVCLLDYRSEESVGVMLGRKRAEEPSLIKEACRLNARRELRRDPGRRFRCAGERHAALPAQRFLNNFFILFRLERARRIGQPSTRREMLKS